MLWRNISNKVNVFWLCRNFAIRVFTACQDNFIGKSGLLRSFLLQCQQVRLYMYLCAYVYMYVCMM